MVSCKYSSKHQQKLNGQIYQPYPNEPQCYMVNNVKIHNVDFQNRPQIRGLIETIKKDLKIKNTAIEAAKHQMKPFVKEKVTDGEATASQLGMDINSFQQNNQQLMAWI